MSSGTLNQLSAGGWELVETVDGSGNVPALRPRDAARLHFEVMHVEGYSLAVAAIDPVSGKMDQRFVSRARDAITFARRWDGERNLYASVNLFPAGHRGGRTIEEVAAFQGVLIDLDPDASLERIDKEEVPSNLGAIRDAASRLLGEPRIPALQMFSGRGVQAVLLGVPIALETPEERVHANQNATELVAALRADSEVRGFLDVMGLRMDPTGDLAHLMRLAGTRNLKSGRRAELHLHAGVPRRCDWLGNVIRGVRVGGMANPRSQTKGAIPNRGGPIPPPLPDWAGRVISSHPRLRAMWNADVPLGQRSTHEYRLGRLFCEVANERGHRITREVLASLIWEKPHGKAAGRRS